MHRAKASFSKNLRTVIAITAASLAPLFGPGVAHAADGKFDPTQPDVVSADTLEFRNTPFGLSSAPAWGNRENGRPTGPHGNFAKLPPHFTMVRHTHSAGIHVVVISGTMINPHDGEADAVKMGPGTYFYVPAHMVHAEGCVSDTPCLFYYHAEEPFDLKPVQP